jgi:cysteinyl-tRNA synthetase
MLTIYNTLTKKKEVFKPIEEGKVSIYVCGPTVYNYFHIGNGRSFIMSDVIRRYFIYKGYEVKYVMNITDVDDKIIKKAVEQNADYKEVTKEYTNAFFEDLKKLGVMYADVHPRATEHMDDIISLIKKLEEKGYAYNVNGNVFYNVGKFSGYGKLSGKKTDELESGSRIEINEEKQNPLDFSLWKKAKEGEPYWDSPWGKGRPGWHIECSAMSCRHLGESFDIHAGGNDLIFPHHENEIAQSEAATNKKFVNYWIHFGFLNINDEKMSKSLGNFFTARDVVKRFPAEVIRLFFSQTHYAGPLNFSDDLLTGAQKGLEKIENLYDKLTAEVNSSGDNQPFQFNFEEYKNKFEEAMDDDFNTPQAAAVIFDFVKEVNRYLVENPSPGKEFYNTALDYLNSTAGAVLGIISKDKISSQQGIENELIEFIIQLRLDARKEKDWALSDKIRDGLKELGVILQDSKDKTTYKRVKQEKG